MICRFICTFQLRAGLHRAAVTVPLVAVLAAAVLLSAGCRDATDLPETTSSAPETAVAAFLEEHKLQGQIVLIEFGSLDCSMSEDGLYEMIWMHREKTIPKLAYARVEVGSDKQAADEYFKRESPGFTVHYDADASLARSCDATAYPTFVLVGKFGRVRYRGNFPQESQLSRWVETLLAEKTDGGPNVNLFGVAELEVPKLLAATRIPDLAGTVKPLSNYMGQKGLLVIFVDTNCPFSGQAISEMPEVAAVLALHEVPSVLVNLDDPKSTVLAFYAKQNMTMPILYDTTTATKERGDVSSVPTVVLLDTKGIVAYRGTAVWSTLAAAAEKRLALPAGSLKFEAEGTEFG